MKVLMCGDRNWTDEETIVKELLSLPKDTLIITGGARGADSIAEAEAYYMGMPTIVFHANWARYAKAAGPMRNSTMLMENPDLVIAFHTDISKSKGTADTVCKARKLGIPVKIVGAS